MQGRLLPKYQGRYQAHPIGYWQDEFSIASKLGLDCIEFIFDYNDYKVNPLLTDHGRKQIRSLSEKTGVKVFSICADYFMEAPLHSNDKDIAKKSFNVLKELLYLAGDLGIEDVVIPCVDQSSIHNRQDRDRFISTIYPAIIEAESMKVNLSLETDLSPLEFKHLLTELQSDYLTVNYDIGNSAALGYDPAEEFSCYGKHISDIHIKDRLRGEGSVELGSGHADFDKVFSLICGSGYQGPLIMQVYRDDEGVEVFKSQLNWLQERFSS